MRGKCRRSGNVKSRGPWQVRQMLAAGPMASRTIVARQTTSHGKNCGAGKGAVSRLSPRQRRGYEQRSTAISLRRLPLFLSATAHPRSTKFSASCVAAARNLMRSVVPVPKGLLRPHLPSRRGQQLRQAVCKFGLNGCHLLRDSGLARQDGQQHAGPGEQAV